MVRLMKSADVLPPAQRLDLTGTARVGRRLRTVLPRLEPGDIAVIDVIDLDRAGAQALVDAEVAAVLNASALISGRYANLGPEVLAAAGIVVLDELGAEAFEAIRDGATLSVSEEPASPDEPLRRAGVSQKGKPIGSGRVLDGETVGELMTAARGSMGVHLESFSRNTTEFLKREQAVLLHREGVPELPESLRDRPGLVVVPGDGHAAELASVRRWLKQADPVLIGVEGGADALRKAGLRPDVIVVDASRRDVDGSGPSQQALRKARVVVARVDRGGASQARGAIERLGGANVAAFETNGTSEDAALILADHAGAPVVVGVGLHATLEEFLDTRRAGLPSTFLTRLALGPRLVDAAAVPSFVVRRGSWWPLLLVLVIGLLAVAAAIATTPVGQDWLHALSPRLSGLAADWSDRLRDWVDR